MRVQYEVLKRPVLGFSFGFDNHYGYDRTHFHIKFWLLWLFVVITVGDDGSLEA